MEAICQLVVAARYDSLRGRLRGSMVWSGNVRGGGKKFFLN
jgi:hypothetical protein